MSGDEPNKEDVHVTLERYQYEYLSDQNYNMSAVIREALDDRIIEDGADPEVLRESYRD